MSTPHVFLLGLIASLSLGMTLGVARAQDADTDIWRKVHQTVFAGRAFETASEPVIALEIPDRAFDAAVVPLVIRTQPPANRHIQKIYLVVDKNPSPLGAVFSFTPDAGRTDIETRVRIHEYSHVRAIAESDDGKLYMAVHYVKTSGGCSAPPRTDARASLAGLGKLQLRPQGEVRFNEPMPLHLMISHPNHTGLAMDQLTRLYTPARFVRTVEVTYAGKPILSAELDFTISENPNFRFYFVPRGDGELKAVIIDSDNAKFESSVTIRGGVVAAPG
jgi:sulfur-oxidizing protein SoxY